MIYVGASYYAEGVDAAIDDGYFLDLTDLVDEYMPNYEKIRTSDIQYEAALHHRLRPAGRCGAAPVQAGPLAGSVDPPGLAG